MPLAESAGIGVRASGAAGPFRQERRGPSPRRLAQLMAFDASQAPRRMLGPVGRAILNVDPA
jgi:hypothetical protein